MKWLMSRNQSQRRRRRLNVRANERQSNSRHDFFLSIWFSFVIEINYHW